jgi:hypothetical protein
MSFFQLILFFSNEKTYMPAMHGMMNGLEKNLNSSFFEATKNRSSIQKKAVARKI